MQRLGDELAAGIIQMIATAEPTGGNVSISFEAQRQSGFGAEGGIAGLSAYSAASAVMCFT